MTSDFNVHHDSKRQFSAGSAEEKHPLQSADALDNLKRDRFELLSAYLDGEITAAERRQVETWLSEDPTIQQLYARLLKLRQGLRHMPIPAAEQPVEETVDQVFSQLRRRPTRVLTWGGMAIAAAFVTALFGNVGGIERAAHQFAEAPGSDVVSSDALMIALDRPILEIPKAPISAPGYQSTDTLGNSTSDIR